MVMASRVKVPPVLIVFQPVASQPILTHPIMSSVEEKILGRLLRLALPRFSSSPREDAYEFRISCEDRIYNLGLVKTFGIDYTTFQFNLTAQLWWRGYMDLDHVDLLL